MAQAITSKSMEKHARHFLRAYYKLVYMYTYLGLEGGAEPLGEDGQPAPAPFKDAIADIAGSIHVMEQELDWSYYSGGVR